MRKNDDLISRQDALSFLRNWERVKDYSWGERNIIKATINEIESLPSAQPERKKGKWTKDCACEICGFKPWYERDIHTLSFCPNCGADLRGDNHDQSK